MSLWSRPGHQLGHDRPGALGFPRNSRLPVTTKFKALEPVWQLISASPSWPPHPGDHVHERDGTCISVELDPGLGPGTRPRLSAQTEEPTDSWRNLGQVSPPPMKMPVTDRHFLFQRSITLPLHPVRGSFSLVGLLTTNPRRVPRGLIIMDKAIPAGRRLLHCQSLMLICC